MIYNSSQIDVIGQEQIIINKNESLPPNQPVSPL